MNFFKKLFKKEKNDWIINYIKTLQIFDPEKNKFPTRVMLKLLFTIEDTMRDYENTFNINEFKKTIKDFSLRNRNFEYLLNDIEKNNKKYLENLDLTKKESWLKIMEIEYPKSIFEQEMIKDNLEINFDSFQIGSKMTKIDYLIKNVKAKKSFLIFKAFIEALIDSYKRKNKEIPYEFIDSLEKLNLKIKEEK